MANWAKIKIEYLEGKKPIELAKKYKVAAKTISNRASEENWQGTRGKIQEEIQSNFEKEILEGTALAIKTLLEVARTAERDSDRVSAAKGLLDISGLKKEKRENELSGELIQSLVKFVN